MAATNILEKTATDVSGLMEQGGEFIERIPELLAKYGMRLVGAILIFLIGKWVAGLVRKIIVKVMEKNKLEPMLVSFVGSLSYSALVVFVVIAAISTLGIQTASLVAVLGAAGLAVGLALQGSLSNFAAGVLMVIFKPFRVGDFIEAAGTIGVVEETSIFTTVVNTPDNKKTIVPNSKIMADNIINYTAHDKRRVDLTAGISYEDDIDKARAAIQTALATESRILKDPAPTIAVVEMADSSVNFVVRPWCTPADYWDVYFGVTEAIKKQFDAEGISIPFPQRDVHLYEHKEG